jgi:hypothetical protein
VTTEVLRPGAVDRIGIGEELLVELFDEPVVGAEVGAGGPGSDTLGCGSHVVFFLVRAVVGRVRCYRLGEG